MLEMRYIRDVSKMELVTTTDGTGALQIRLPGPPRRQPVRVVVEWDEGGAAQETWPAGWLEAVVGSIADPTFVRPEQGEFEAREELA